VAAGGGIFFVIGYTTIPKNFIFREPWLSSAARRLRSAMLSHKGYAFAGALLQRPTKPPALRGPDLLCALPIILFVIGYIFSRIILII
jgi:hypothetical protein